MKERILFFMTDEPEEKIYNNRLLPKIKEACESHGCEVIEVNVFDSDIESRNIRYLSSDVEAYLEKCKCSIEEFDRLHARIPNLLLFNFDICIFPISRNSFKNSILRNAFLFSSDASDLRPDILCIPVLIGIQYEEAKDICKTDEHLNHSVRRSEMEFNIQMIDEIIITVREFLEGLPRNKSYWKKVQLYISIAKTLIMISLPLEFLLILFNIFGFSIIVVAAKTHGLSISLLKIVTFLASFFSGFALSTVPAAAAFQNLCEDKGLSHRKRGGYVFRLGFSTGIWAIGIVFGYFNSYHLILFIFAFLIGVFEPQFRLWDFYFRLRLTGLEHHDKYMKESTIKIFSPYMAVRILSKYMEKIESNKPILFSEEDEEISYWDFCAQRESSCGRNFIASKPIVFISYRFTEGIIEEDIELAKKFEKYLNDQGVECIRYKLPIEKKIKTSASWRANIASDIARSSHLVVLLSKKTVSGETCNNEVRQAIGIIHISVKPTIIICLLDPEPVIKAEIKYPVFSYLLNRSYRIDKSDLTDHEKINNWLNRTMPNTWIQDFLQNAIPVMKRILLVWLGLGFFFWGFYRQTLPSINEIPLWPSIVYIVASVTFFIKAFSRKY